MDTPSRFGEPLQADDLFSRETFAARLSKRGDTVWLAVAGELDAFTAPKLRSAIRGAPMSEGDSLVIDLRGLRFMDSSGLAAVLAAHERAATDGRSPLRLCISGSPPVEALFETIGAAQYLNLIDGPAEIGAVSARD